MADAPVFALPAPEAEVTVGGVTITDESATAKWRTWTDQGVAMGRAGEVGGAVVLAVAPDEWLGIGGDAPADAVDLTHVRAMFRVSGPATRELMSYVCALDLSDLMTPNRSAARTLVAGVATELVRDDTGDEASYLLLMSRSFAHSVWQRLKEVAERL